MIDDPIAPLGAAATDPLPSSDSASELGGGGASSARPRTSRGAGGGWSALVKPAMAGGAVGAIAGALLPSVDLGRGLLWGALAGAAYGYMRR